MALPPSLARHRTYHDRAEELKNANPLVALQLRLMLLQLAMRQRQQGHALSEVDALELKQWLLAAMEQCERERSALGSSNTPCTADHAQVALRAFGLDLLARAGAADKPDVYPSASLPWTVQMAPLVAQSYHAGAVCLDCLKQYGPLPADISHAQQRALDRSRSLANALSQALNSVPCIPVEWEPVSPGLLADGAQPSVPHVPSSAGGTSAVAPRPSAPAASATEPPSTAQTAAGAAAVGGLAAAGVAGSALLGVAAAGAVAYTAIFDKEGGGDAARATGRAAVAGVAKAREVDAEYDLSTKAGGAAQAAGAAMASAWDQARAYDEQHRVRERIGAAAQAGLAKAQELDAEYKIGENAGAAARVVGQAASTGLDTVLSWLNKPPVAAPAEATTR